MDFTFILLHFFFLQQNGKASMGNLFVILHIKYAGDGENEQCKEARRTVRKMTTQPTRKTDVHAKSHSSEELFKCFFCFLYLTIASPLSHK